METILIKWLTDYTGATVVPSTKFTTLNFDIFDEAMTVDFVKNTYNINVNKNNQWFNTVQDLIDVISASTQTHV